MQPRQDLFLIPLLIQDQQPSQHVVAYLVRPAVPEALLLRAGFLIVLVFIVELGEEVADGLEVGPAISIEHGAVHGIVQAAQFDDVIGHLAGVVEAVVGLRQAFVVPDHQRGTEVVVGLAGCFQRRGGSQSREEKGRSRSSPTACSEDRSFIVDAMKRAQTSCTRD